MNNWEVINIDEQRDYEQVNPIIEVSQSLLIILLPKEDLPVSIPLPQKVYRSCKMHLRKIFNSFINILELMKKKRKLISELDSVLW